MFDARKSLPVFYQEWANCEVCFLGKRRKLFDAKLVPGEGVRRGIMFVGQSPNAEDEEMGVIASTPKSGMLIKDILRRMNFNDYYMTNLTLCRSCEPVVDESGNYVLQKRGRVSIPRMRQHVPLPSQIQACLNRLYEEIYLVDPVIIVALGAIPAEALLKRPVAITRDRGRAVHCEIPGATLRPVLTEKKKAWGRKINGRYEYPTEQNTVRYLLMPTFETSYVMQKSADNGFGSTLHQLVEDIRLAVKTYERYQLEGLGLKSASDSDVDLSMEVENAEED